MKAYVLYEAGTPDKLILGEVPKPILKNGEVLVKVKAIGVNPADAIYRSSDAFLDAMFGKERPVIIGWDIAGEIVEKAEGTDGFELGDGVLALSQNAHGYAEFIAINIDSLAHKPKNISFEDAAALPMAGMTAYQPLIHAINIKKGDTILIHAASGGVGHFAVQIAKSLGAVVIATSSEQKRDFVMSLGADKHVDYHSENFWEVLKDVDFVLDTVGGETLAHSVEVTKPGGTVVSIIGPADDQITSNANAKNVKIVLWGMRPNGSDLRSLIDLMANGSIKPHISKTYPFENMIEAHQQIETRRTEGKIVVKGC